MSLTHSNDIPAPVANDVGPHDPHGVHAVPKRVLLTVYSILIFCTILTVVVSKIDLGSGNIWAALLIAVVKGGLVVMYFMHLRWDSPFNGMALISRAVLRCAVHRPGPVGFAFVSVRDQAHAHGDPGADAVEPGPG